MHSFWGTAIWNNGFWFGSPCTTVAVRAEADEECVIWTLHITLFFYSSMKFLNTFSKFCNCTIFHTSGNFLYMGAHFFSLLSALCHTKAHTIALKSCLSDPAVKSVCVHSKKSSIIRKHFLDGHEHGPPISSSIKLCVKVSVMPCHGPSPSPNQVYLQLVCHHVCHQMGFCSLYNIGKKASSYERVSVL